MIEETLMKVERAARFYKSWSGSGKPKEVWVVIHGYGQLARYFIKKFSGLAGNDVMVIAPEALNYFYVSGFSGRIGASWMTGEKREDEINDYLNYLEKLAHEEIPAGIPVSCLGFSQGAETASRWVAKTKINIERLLLWGGIAAPDLSDEDISKLNRIKIETVIGDKDEFISPDMAEKLIKKMRDKFAALKVHRYNGGHDIDPATLNEIIL